jgi:hypothetical protein
MPLETGQISIGLMIPHVGTFLHPSPCDLMYLGIDYEQQRLHLLHKHGIDLEDPNGIADGRKTRWMDRKQIELLMSGGEGQGGLFTWREKNRRKVGHTITTSCCLVIVHCL